MSETPESCPNCGSPVTGGRFCANCGRSVTISNADPLIGMVLMGQFAVQRRLGRGGWATVYEADQTTMDRPVAIKVLHRELLGEQDAVQRFFMEARSASRLNHPNILRPWLVGQLDDGTPYLVMDVVEGPTLADVMKEEGPLQLERALGIAVQIAAALDEAASCGVVHRDLKPSNIFLAVQGRRMDVVRLADFGIAKVLSDEAAGLTRTGDILGTPAYMAPEQASGQRIDARADVYAFGVILYRMLSGRLPFDETSVMTLLAAHVGKPPRPLHEAMPGVRLPDGLEDTVMAMLAKSPSDRPSTAGEVGEELRRIAARAGLAVSDQLGGSTPLPVVPEVKASAAAPSGPAQAERITVARSREAVSGRERTDLAVLAWTDDEPPPATPVGLPAPEPPALPDGPSLAWQTGRGRGADEEDGTTTVMGEDDVAKGPIPLVGTGQPGFSGDGGPGLHAQLFEPAAVARDVLGNVFVVDAGNHCVRYLDCRGGVVRTLIGLPEEPGYSGDDGPAEDALLNDPCGIAVDATGNLYVADRGNRRVRAVDVRSGRIGTVAGSGRVGPSPDGTPAHLAGFVPEALALGPDGGLYVADAYNHRVWRLDGQDGTVATVAGVGEPGFSGDGGPARGASLDGPVDLAFDRRGVLYVADRGNGRIRSIDPGSGRIETVAGGDGTLGAPCSVAVARDGTLRVADSDGGRILAVDPRTGGSQSLAEDLVEPRGIFVDAEGTLMVADTGRHRVWAIIER